MESDHLCSTAVSKFQSLGTITQAILFAVSVCLTLFAIWTVRNWLSSEADEELAFANKIGKARGFAEMCAISGYAHEEHTVTTPDGYLLLLQRILPKCSATPSDASKRRPVVYIQHGLLTNSELFMAVSDAKRCLPFVLVDNGYDVWLGNNRYVQNFLKIYRLVTVVIWQWKQVL